MEEQVFLNFNVRFNLRQRKVNKPTPIYAVVCYGMKQWKINSGVKVYPQHWNRDKQIALCSGLSKLDIHNNSIVNNKLKEILLCFEQMKFYICNNVEELDNIYSILKTFINPQMKSKMAKKSNQNMTLALKKVVGWKTSKDSSKSIDNGHINVFGRFISKREITNTLDNLNLKTLEEYQRYLIDEKMNKSSIQQYCVKIVSLAKLISKYPEFEYNYKENSLDKFVVVDNKVAKKQKSGKQIALTEDDLNKLWAYNELKPKEKEVRDLFILQCLVGQRIGDMPKFFTKGGYELGIANNVEIIKFIQEKRNELAIIPLSQLAKNILEKYKEGFKYLSLNVRRFDDEITRTIKIVAKKAGFNEEITYTDEKGNDVVRITKPKYEMIKSHVARHTFITLMCRMGVRKEIVIIATGHADTTMIDEVYLHESEEDRVNKITNAVSGLNGTLFNMGVGQKQITSKPFKNGNNKDECTINEAREQSNDMNDCFKWDSEERIKEYLIIKLKEENIFNTNRDTRVFIDNMVWFFIRYIDKYNTEVDLHSDIDNAVFEMLAIEAKDRFSKDTLNKITNEIHERIWKIDIIL